MLDSAQEEVRTTFISGDFEQSAKKMQELAANNVYDSKDKVLLYLEQGSVNHFAGNYEASNQFFENAEFTIDDLFTKSITRAIQSFIVNDNSLAYDGEDYEDVYLNVFKTLNYIHLNDLEGALVESRRVSYKLGQLNLKYNDLVSALSKADTTQTDPDKWKTGETNVQNSALGHYLATILYAKTGKSDDARISYNNLVKAYSDQPSVYGNNTPDPRALFQLTEPNSYNVIIKAFSGRSPVKRQNDTRFYFKSTDTYLKFSLPELELYPSQISHVKIKVDNGTPGTISLLEHMDLVAREVYRVKEPIIYARTIVRASLKAYASKRASKKISKENETLGSVFNLLGKVAQETTEKADLRGWQTMPGKVHGTVLNLSPGSHTIEIQYYSKSDVLLFSEVKTIEISPQKSLHLIESIYPH